MVQYSNGLYPCYTPNKILEVNMRVDEILSTADTLKENGISEEIKLQWLNDVEGRVHCEIMGKASEDFVALKTTKDELSIPIPYANVYLNYILAMMAFIMKEYELYTDLTLKYERNFSEYAKYCLRKR